MTVRGGPTANALDFTRRVKADTNFRIVTQYVCQHDRLITRLDVKYGERQFNVLLASEHMSDLGLPPSLEGGHGVCVERQDLIDALRGLADKLDEVGHG